MSDHTSRCRCGDCMEYRRETHRRYRADKKAGRSSFVDAQPVRAHVNNLIRYGMGWHRVAVAARVPSNTLSYLLYGSRSQGKPPAKRVHVMTARRLLAVTFKPDEQPDNQTMDGTGTRRRLQALHYAGWTWRQVAARLGVREQAVGIMLRHGLVLGRTFRAVKAVHAELWDVEPPQDTPHQCRYVAQAKRRARDNGWVPTVVWEDIDDIDEVPTVAPELDSGYVDEIAVRRVVDGADPSQLTRAEKLAAARLMVLKGSSPHTVGSRLNLSHHTVRRAAA